MKFFTEPNAVDVEIRSEILKYVKQALLKYMVDENLTENI